MPAMASKATAKYRPGTQARDRIIRDGDRMNFADDLCPGPDDDYQLADDEIHVWRSDLSVSALEIVRLKLIISLDERERAERFNFECDRQRSIIGRGRLRLLLGKILGLPASSLRFEYDGFGKPKLTSTQEQRLQFNVSHSGDLVLIAVTRGRAVGVDVERIRGDIDVDGLAKRFFSTNENERLNPLTGRRRYDAFFTCWTRKEAYLKGRGDGLSLPLDQFDVSFLPDEEPRLLETRFDPAEVRGWTLRSVNVPSGYVASLAAEGTDWNVVYHDWTEWI